MSEAKKILTLESILAADDAKVQTVNVPEWGGDVCVRVMSGTDRDRFESSIMVAGKVSTDQFRAKLVAATVCDEEGKLLCSDQLHVEQLGRKSSVALSRVFDAAQKLNGLTKDDVDEMVKN